MNVPSSHFARYQDLQRYVAWSASDVERIAVAKAVVTEHFPVLIDDFYAELQRHTATSKVITGGQPQIERLKQSLLQWLSELFAGPYDEAYISRRWKVGQRHVAIGLPQVFTAAAFSRLRNGLIRVLAQYWKGEPADLISTLQSLNRLLDLDLTIIGDAYETAFVQSKEEAERKRLDDVLHREKELSAGLLSNAQAAVLILDQNGRIMRCNPFVETLAHDFLAGSALGKDWIELFLNPEDRPRVREAMLVAPRRSGPTELLANSTLVSQGRRRQLRWAGVSLHDAEGLPFAMLLIGHDVTDLFDAQHRALQAERLAAIGQMATGIAHESRNALQRIGASAEMLELEMEGNPAALELVTRIEQSKDHLHQLLEEVRSYAAPIILDRSRMRITEVWREAWELLFQQRRGRDVTFHEDLGSANLLIFADRFRLVQVFRNLLDNSLAAGDDPLRIDIRCEPALLAELPATLVRLRDNGQGLSAEQRRKIFEPFYTTKPTGTGLGTAIAQRLIEAHGGTIEVGESSSAGTEILITLPCANIPS